MLLRLLWATSWAAPSAMLFATLRTNLCHPLALFSVQPQAPQNPQLVRQV
jgi:hypothetical protein